MSNLSWTETVRQVHQRADYQCEYCQTGQRVMDQAMHVEHIDPDAGNTLANLCLACASCNLSKGSAISAPDTETGDIVSLFNPRTQVWSEHFEWIENGMMLRGLTQVGRATIGRLRMNIVRMVNARKVWVRAGEQPPD